MTYEEIVAKVKKEFGSADVSKYEGHLALQIKKRKKYFCKKIKKLLTRKKRACIII